MYPECAAVVRFVRGEIFAVNLSADTVYVLSAPVVSLPVLSRSYIIIGGLITTIVFESAVPTQSCGLECVEC